jgi:hypothetical protein
VAPRWSRAPKGAHIPNSGDRGPIRSRTRHTNGRPFGWHRWSRALKRERMRIPNSVATGPRVGRAHLKSAQACTPSYSCSRGARVAGGRASKGAHVRTPNSFGRTRPRERTCAHRTAKTKRSESRDLVLDPKSSVALGTGCGSHESRAKATHPTPPRARHGGRSASGRAEAQTRQRGTRLPRSNGSARAHAGK